MNKKAGNIVLKLLAISTAAFFGLAFTFNSHAESSATIEEHIKEQTKEQTKEQIEEQTKETDNTLKKYAVVDFSVDFLREKADYTAELGNQVLMGTVAEIIDTDSYWTKVKTPEPYIAWANSMGLIKMTQKEVEEYIAAPKYICTTDYTHIFTKPNYKSERISDFVLGNIVRIWYENGKIVKKNGFYGIIMPSGKKGFVQKKDVENFKKWAKKSDASFKNIKKTAFRFLGVPYMWGGTSIKSVDCSGLSRSVWFANGVLLPRNASQQAKAGARVDFHPNWNITEDSPGFRNEMLSRISFLKPGDLLFFGKRGINEEKDRVTHVAIYLGNGKYIHSSQKVRISSLDPADKGDMGYERAFIKARRLIGREGKNERVIKIIHSSNYFPTSTCE